MTNSRQHLFHGSACLDKRQSPVSVTSCNVSPTTEAFIASQSSWSCNHYFPDQSPSSAGYLLSSTEAGRPPSSNLVAVARPGEQRPHVSCVSCQGKMSHSASTKRPNQLELDAPRRKEIKATSPSVTENVSSVKQSERCLYDVDPHSLSHTSLLFGAPSSNYDELESPFFRCLLEAPTMGEDLSLVEDIVRCGGLESAFEQFSDITANAHSALEPGSVAAEQNAASCGYSATFMQVSPTCSKMTPIGTPNAECDDGWPHSRCLLRENSVI